MELYKKSCRKILFRLSLSVVIMISCSQKKELKSNYRFNIDTVNFKTIKKNDTLIRTVYILNESNLPIKIMDVENGCGCTSTLLNDSIIKSKDSLPLVITYIPSIVKDSGEIIKFLSLRSNSIPAFLNLTIKGKVSN